MTHKKETIHLKKLMVISGFKDGESQSLNLMNLMLDDGFILSEQLINISTDESSFLIKNRSQ